MSHCFLSDREIAAWERGKCQETREHRTVAITWPPPPPPTPVIFCSRLISLSPWVPGDEACHGLSPRAVSTWELARGGCLVSRLKSKAKSKRGLWSQGEPNESCQLPSFLRDPEPVTASLPMGSSHGEARVWRGGEKECSSKTISLLLAWPDSVWTLSPPLNLHVAHTSISDASPPQVHLVRPWLFVLTHQVGPSTPSNEWLPGFLSSRHLLYDEV